MIFDRAEYWRSSGSDCVFSIHERQKGNFSTVFGAWRRQFDDRTWMVSGGSDNATEWYCPDASGSTKVRTSNNSTGSDPSHSRVVPILLLKCNVYVFVHERISQSTRRPL
jgi:hypothetical protein